MKAYKTVIFILSVLLGLALISVFFPKEGINLGGTKIEFPSLEEALAVDTNLFKTTEELAMEEKMAQLHDAKDKEFREFCASSPNRIYCPGNDITYLDGLFEQMDTARVKHVRIIHLGDSQLEGDRMTSTLRERFQTTFGGHGVGMIPAQQPVGTYTLSQSISPASIKRVCAYGPADWHGNHHRYGVMASMTRIEGSATITVKANGNEKFPHSQKFKKITVYGKGSGSVSAKVGEEKYSLKPDTEKSDVTRFFTVSLPNYASHATISISGSMDVYGIMLDDDKGISIDNVPMRGASGTFFTSIDANTIEPFFKHENVGLIILQYGGNSTPYLKTEKAIENYKQNMKKQIALFRKMSPNSKILFIGPADMATRIGGVKQSYPMMPAITKALREAANEEGAAYWDMFSVMGGMNSMVKWADEEQPPLAGKDYIHFTQLGAQKMTDYLFETLHMYYKFYRFRIGKEIVETADTTKTKAPADSTAVKKDKKDKKDKKGKKKKDEADEKKDNTKDGKKDADTKDSKKKSEAKDSKKKADNDKKDDDKSKKKKKKKKKESKD